jgi:HEAT repeat protein
MTTRERLRAIAARGRAEPGDLDVVWEALAAPGKAEQRGAAETLAALARAGNAGALLDQALADTVPRRRWAATYARALLGPLPPACLPILLEALGDDDGDLRWASAAILRAQVELSELPVALRGLLGSRNPLQRKMALYCLRDLAVPDASMEPALTAALDDAETGVRLAAMSALAALATDRGAAAAALVRRLDDPDAGVRRAAAAAVGRLRVGDVATRAALERASAADDPALARAARRALAGCVGAG